MDERDRLQQQMSEIGDRYLRRTLGEMGRLRELFEQLRAQGSTQAKVDIEHMAHKIHGNVRYADKTLNILNI